LTILLLYDVIIAILVVIGLDHFDDFRFFHFHQMPIKNESGDLKNVGVMQCKAAVNDNVWHDTRGNTQNTIPLFKGTIDITNILKNMSFLRFDQ
jgi:hypothetical protein